MGNAQGGNFVSDVMEIQARTWLAMTPPSFSARDKVVAEGNDCVKRLKVLLNMLDFVETPKSYKPTEVLDIKVLCEDDWFVEWKVLQRLVDELESSEPTQTDLECAKPHIALCVQRLEKGVKRYR